MALALDAQLLLALQDLRTERLLTECEALIIHHANIEAQEAALHGVENLTLDRSTL